MKAAYGLVVGAACAGVIACGAGAHKAAAPSAAPPSEATGAMPASPRDRIAALDQQIDRDLAQLSLARPTITPGIEPSPMSAGTTSPAVCAPAKTETCSDTCRLKDSICANASSICRIANDDLGGTDAYANEKCQSGTASCAAATQRCCGCT